jgi:hypothetical protein
MVNSRALRMVNSRALRMMSTEELDGVAEVRATDVAATLFVLWIIETRFDAL